MLALYARKLVAYVWVALQKVVVTYSNKKELMKESNAGHFLSHVFAFEFSLGILKSVHSTMKHFMFWIVERPILFFFCKALCVPMLSFKQFTNQLENGRYAFPFQSFDVA